MIQVVADYSKYVNNIKNYINESPYKTNFFIDMLKMPKATFYRKMREHNFTIKEVEILTKILFPEELLKMELQKSEEDIKAGRVKAHDVVMKNLKTKYFS